MNYYISYSHPLWENGWLLIKWIDIDLSSSSGVVKCCVIIGLSNLTSLCPTFPVKMRILQEILPLGLFVHIVTSHVGVWWVIFENIWYWWIGFYFMLYDSKSPPFSSNVILELCSLTGASLKIWIVKSETRFPY